MHSKRNTNGHNCERNALVPTTKVKDFSVYITPGGGGTLIFSHIRRLGPFFGVQNSEFQYFLGFSEK